MSIVLYVIPATILFLVALYFIFLIKRILNEVSCDRIKFPYLIATIILIVIITIGYLLNLWIFIVALLHILFINILFWIICCLIEKSGKSKGRKSNVRKLYNLAIIPIAMTVVIIFSGFFNMTDIVKIEYTLTSDKLSHDENIEIAMIADSHLDNAIKAQDLEEPCKEISNEYPDIFVLVGDIFDENTSKATMEAACKVLGSVKTRKGIFYVYGNHDKSTYGGNSNYSEEEIEKNLEANGIVVLKDQVVSFDDFELIGRMDYSGDLSNSPRAKLPSLMENVDKDKYIIDLDHQPQETLIAANQGVDLQLSGHTHGGQIWPAGLLNYVFHFNDYEYGLESDGEYNIIVTSGISGWGLPIRTEKHSEYVLININGK